MNKIIMTLDRLPNQSVGTSPAISSPPDMLQLGVLVSFLVIAVRWLANWLTDSAKSEDKEKEAFANNVLAENVKLTNHLIKMNEALIGKLNHCER